MNAHCKLLVTMMAGLIPFTGALADAETFAASGADHASLATAVSGSTVIAPASASPTAAKLSVLATTTAGAAAMQGVAEQDKDGLQTLYFCRPGSLIKYRIRGAHLPDGCRVPKRGSCL